MSRAASLSKLARAAHLSAQAAKLYAEAAEELASEPGPDEVPEVTEVDQARARRSLRRAGARI